MLLSLEPFFPARRRDDGFCGAADLEDMHFGIFSVSTGRQSGGPETYEKCLLRALLEIDSRNEYTVFCFTPKARDAFHLERPNLHYSVLVPNVRWISAFTSLPYKILTSRLDLLHATVYAPPLSSAKYIFTMHCFSNFAMPELYPASIRLPLNRSILKGLAKSCRVLCVSENVRDHVIERFRIPADKLSVVYNGVGPEFHPTAPEQARTEVRRRYGVDAPYILFVGQLKARKNVVRLVDAFGLLHRESRYRDCKLVLAGRRIWGAEGISEAIERNGVQKNIVELGHVPHEDLPMLYSAAELFVFPSLWEGFGIPIIEAMACGVPVVTSNASCMPEIAGGCAVLVNPLSVEEIASGMASVLSEPNKTKELRRKGLERAKMFSWKKTAEQTLRFYELAASFR
jgi:glycosyltransferase involved in cell wall biosynthesis